MSFVDGAAIALAAWRLASLMVREAGPFGVFYRWREMIGVTHDQDGLPAVWPGNGVAALFSCVWCMSVWTAVLAYVVWWIWPVPVYVLAASALAIALQEALERLKG